MAKRSKIEKKLLVGATALLLFQAGVAARGEVKNYNAKNGVAPKTSYSQNYSHKIHYGGAPMIKNQN